MNATAQPFLSETAGGCPDFAQSAEQNGTVPFAPTVSQPVLIVPSVPGLDIVRPANILRLSQIERKQGQDALPQGRCFWPHGWLWPQRIAIGKVTVIVGENGLGKSSIAADLAARVSKGSPWPEEDGGRVENGAG